MTYSILLAGFGGQGLLFAGKQLALAAMDKKLHVTWLPSYGPEMRGGTANCSVIISDEPVGSPIVSRPDVLIAMNLPSLDKYEDTVVPGGTIYVDSTLIERKVKRTDVKVVYIPATKLASDNKTPTLANMIIMGKVLSVEGQFDDEEGVMAALKKVISAKRADMLEVNMNVMRLGHAYQE